MNALFLKRKTIDGVKHIKRISRSTVLVLQEAEKRGIEWEKLPYTELFKLTYNNKTKYFHAQIPADTSEFAVYCCDNKRVSRSLLEEANIAVSAGYLIRHSDSEEYQKKTFEHLQKPVVIKPIHDNQGTNVELNITELDDFLTKIEQIKKFYGKKKVELLVEEMFVGDEYRILATRKKILSVIKRVPANVVGDGTATIAQLIEKKNQDPIRQKVGTYKDILVDAAVEEYLAAQNLTLQSVLPKDTQVFLREHSPLDISLGGDTVDVTDQIHESVHTIVSKIIASIPGLSLTGIDYMTEDITAPQTADNYRIIEINASPSLDWNEYPLVGPKREVAYEFLKIMFPDLK